MSEQNLHVPDWFERLVPRVGHVSPTILAAESIRHAFADLSEQWNRQWETLGETLKTLERSLAEGEPAATTLGSWGWTIPSWGPLRYADALVQDFDASEIDACFLDYYGGPLSRNFRSLVQGLQASKSLAPWHSLLTQCVSAYRRRHYAIAVPSLLAAFEGYLFSRADPSLTAKTKAVVVTEHRRATLDPGSARLCWVSMDAFVRRLYSYSDFSAPAPIQLNRHWVLHGRDTRLRDKTDCLRLLQALDTLSMLAVDRYDD